MPPVVLSTVAEIPADPPLLELGSTPEEEVFPADFGCFDNEEKYFDPCSCGTRPLHPESDCPLNACILQVTADPPFCDLPPDVGATNSCNVCKKDATKRCTKCWNVWYCSKECQAANWKEHKTHCKAHTDSNLCAPPVIIQCGSPPPVTIAEVRAPPLSLVTIVKMVSKWSPNGPLALF